MQNSENTPTNESSKPSETISELAYRHMKNPGHTTTDEEMKNAVVVVDGESRPPVELERLIEESESTVIPPIFGNENDDEEKSKQKDEDAGNDGAHIPNPYDVLK